MGSRTWVSVMEVKPRAELVQRGRTMKRLLVTNIPPNLTDDTVLDLALAEAHENRSSLFGWTVNRLPDNPTAARVILHTD